MSDSLSYIDRYFRDELTEEEKKGFERRCIADPAFAGMVAFYISLHEQVEQQWAERKEGELAQLQAEDIFAEEAVFPLNSEQEKNGYYRGEGKEVLADRSHKERETEEGGSLKEGALAVGSLAGAGVNQEQGKVRYMKRWKGLIVAAALLGVMAVGITLYVQNRKEGAAVAIGDKRAGTTKSVTATDTSSAPSNRGDDSTAKQATEKKEAPQKRVEKAEVQQLFARHFTIDPAPAREERPGLLAEAFEQYEKGRYKQASGEYEEVVAEVKSLAARKLEDQEGEGKKEQILFYAHYYNGLSYLAEGKVSKAIKELRAVKESLDRYWEGKRQWYLALAYLGTGEEQKASALLEQVAQSKEAKEYRQRAMRLSQELKGDESIK